MNNIIFSTILAGAVIFFMELGDKTQIASFSLAARFRRPGRVFLGILVGLILVSIIALFFGIFIRDNIPETFLSIIIGALFIIFGLFSTYNSQKQVPTPEKFLEKCPIPIEICPKHKQECMSKPEECPIYIQNVIGKNAFFKSLVVIFAAEIGDKTWFSVAILVTQFHPIGVLVGAIISLALVNGMGVLLGQRFASKIPKKELDILIGVFMISIGLILLGQIVLL